MSNISIQGAATGTGVFTLASPATNTNRTLTLPDEAGTVLTSASDITAQAMNGPAFRAYRTTSQQVISTSTSTKVQFNAETFDTNNCFDSTTNYRFTPNVEGYYQLNSFVQFDGFASGAINMYLFKNGAPVSFSNVGPGAIPYPVVSISDVLYANGSTDYFEIYVTQDSGSNKNIYQGSTPAWCWFSGSMTRGA